MGTLWMGCLPALDEGLKASWVLIVGDGMLAKLPEFILFRREGGCDVGFKFSVLEKSFFTQGRFMLFKVIVGIIIIGAVLGHIVIGMLFLGFGSIFGGVQVLVVVVKILSRVCLVRSKGMCGEV
jgi:hypothetical protein